MTHDDQVIRSRTMLSLAVFVSLFALTSCSGHEKPAATPAIPATEVVGTTPPLPPTPAPGTPTSSFPVIQPGPGIDNVLGPVLVYESGRNLESLVAYDLGHKRIVWRLDRRSNDPDPILSFATLDGGVALSTSSHVYWQPVDGGVAELLLEVGSGRESFTNLSGLPDKSLLAVSIRRPTTPLGTPSAAGQVFRSTGSVLFYDVAQRKEVIEVMGTDDVPLGEGWLTWREDGRGVFLNSYTYLSGQGPSMECFSMGRSWRTTSTALLISRRAARVSFTAF
jgi:hypothetical protein